MIEQVAYRNGEKVIEVRSDGGKLLYKKTRAGYEMKCPRTKQACLIKYEHMMADCLRCLLETSSEEDFLNRTIRIKDLLSPASVS